MSKRSIHSDEVYDILIEENINRLRKYTYTNDKGLNVEFQCISDVAISEYEKNISI